MQCFALAAGGQTTEPKPSDNDTDAMPASSPPVTPRGSKPPSSEKEEKEKETEQPAEFVPTASMEMQVMGPNSQELREAHFDRLKVMVDNLKELDSRVK